jgi:glycosyltransferase involved in cell wall biosynthesis
MPDLATRIPNLRLLIIGDGAQRPLLEKQIRELGLGEQVKITGMVPHDEVPKWIAQADIGVLPFPMDGATRDIFPTKVLQYMTQGKPVVANPLPGLVDFGLGEEQGIVYVRDGDWGEAIKKAIKDRVVLGERARNYTEQNHGYDRMINQLEKEIAELCE